MNAREPPFQMVLDLGIAFLIVMFVFGGTRFFLRVALGAGAPKQCL